MKELARLSKYDLTKATGCSLTVNGGYLHIAAYYPNEHSGIFDAVLVVVLTFAVIGASCRRVSPVVEHSSCRQETCRYHRSVGIIHLKYRIQSINYNQAFILANLNWIVYISK